MRAFIIGIVVACVGLTASAASAQIVEPEVSITGFAHPFIGAMPCPDDPGYPAPSQMTPGSVTLTRTGPTTDPLSVSYEVDGAVATPSGVATFATGSATATFAVVPTNFFGPTIFATVIDGDGYTLGSPSTQRVDVMILPLLTCTGYPLQVSPAAGGIGTEITVSGSTCKSWDPPNWVDVEFWQRGGSMLGSDRVEPDAAGAWSTTFIVPDGLDPSASYAARATCHSEADRVLDYALAPFDLTSPNDTTTATSTTTTATTVLVNEESTSTSTTASTSPTTVASTVVAGNTTTPATVAVLAESDTLPRTGSSTSALTALTTILLAVGIALASSRRRTQS